MNNSIFDRKITHPAAWRSADIGGREGLTHRISREHNEAIWALVEKTRHKAPDATTREDFDDPAVNNLMLTLKGELMNGHGCTIFSGLDLAERSLDDFGRARAPIAQHAISAQQNG